MNLLIHQSLKKSLLLPDNDSKLVKNIEVLFAKNIKLAYSNNNYKMDHFVK
jgi:hypothetical protein